MFPLMTSSLVFLPPETFFLLIPLLFLSIKEFRSGYIGRIGIVVNVFLLWQVFYNQWMFLPGWFQLYLDIGTLVAVVAFMAYIFDRRLPKQFYTGAFVAYGSFTLVIVLANYIYAVLPFLP